MTRRAWLVQAVERLNSAGCMDAAFDARCLLEELGGLARGHRPDETPLTGEQERRLEESLCQRMDGRPLQYILGEWDFLSLTLAVGEGVLIPRPDTETLCETAATALRELCEGGAVAPRVLDLCAGSGCVGLGLASLYPAAQVTAVELSDRAFPFLQKNITRYPRLKVQAVQADVLEQAAQFTGPYGAILSNPPYIPTGALPHLQREVLREPTMALDGAADGLRFYRAIAQTWTAKLAPGGFCAVEVGFDQAPVVKELFRAAGLERVRAVPDLAGIDRVVLGYAPGEK